MKGCVDGDGTDQGRIVLLERAVKAKLMKRGLLRSESAMCLLCTEKVESVDHLFLE